MQTTPRAIAYVRGSFSRHSKSCTREEVQVEEIAQHMKQWGAPVVATYTDDPRDMHRRLWQRPAGPALKQALAQADVASPWSYHFVTHSLNRAWRTISEAATDIHQLLDSYVNVHVVDGGLFLGKSDLADEQALESQRHVLSMLMAVRDFQLEALCERASSGREDSASRGHVIGKPPFGWASNGTILIENTKECRTYGAILQLHEEGLNHRRIAERLNSLGWWTRSQDFWSKRKIRHLLRFASPKTRSLEEVAKQRWLAFLADQL